jgi:hypothetical protein
VNRFWYLLADDGETPIPVEADDPRFKDFWEGDTNRRVAQTTIGDVVVSTVFLGLDHSYTDGPPILWETMIFGGPHNEEQWRYCSRAAAAAHHEAIVAANPPADWDGAWQMEHK